MRTNTKTVSKLKTHEGAPAKRINAEQELRRSIMACLLWEDNFYESGESISKRIAGLVKQLSGEIVAKIASEARSRMKLRHAPLFLAREMARNGMQVKDVLYDIIQRPDELSEFLSIYWKEGKTPIAAQVKKGLAAAFTKFDEYQLAKYNRDADLKLRDVLFLVHAKPLDKKMEKLWKKLIDGTLKTPDTWEVSLSAGADKKESFERLIQEEKLGALALLRNLRNMYESGVSDVLVKGALLAMDVRRVLPFRFITAARYAPAYEPELEQKLFECVIEREKLKGKTVILVDVSGSMRNQISGKTEITRIDAACGLAMIARELSDDCVVYSFSEMVKLVPARRGFALSDVINKSQVHSNTYLGRAIEHINEHDDYDRLIVITDEQSHDRVPNPKTKGYVINVSTNENGVGYGPWSHIDGFSEATIDYILESEKSCDKKNKDV